MRGFLDESCRAMLTIDNGQGPMDFMIDTGFDGSFLMGSELFYPSQSAGYAGSVFSDLASEQVFQYEAWFVEFSWFDEMTRTRVMVGPGTDCLVGTALLVPHRLEIDYEAGTVELIRGSSW